MLTRIILDSQPAVGVAEVDGRLEFMSAGT
jgi:hypothetical protein